MRETESIFTAQKKFYHSGKTKSVAFRKAQLTILKQAVKRYEGEIMKALKADLNKSAFEAYETEIGIVLEEIGFLLKHIDRYAKPKTIKTPLAHFPSTSKIYQEPYGVALIMSPWNYPFQLTISPLAGAISAGNCAVLKPSEYAPHTSAVIKKLILESFEAGYITVVEGDAAVNQELLHHPFDYIFFTGSVAVGKLVMGKAAEHLTPVTLELGGKSPCIVDETADIPLAAKRIAWGKFLNAGQTCVAPDYLLVHKNVKEELIKGIKKYILEFYGQEPHYNEAYPKIIHRRHFERLLELMKSGTIAAGGQYNTKTLQIAPTLLDHVKWEEPVMEDEIFGPLLPVLEYTSLKSATKLINSRPKPLALYYFTRSTANEQYMIRNVSFGGGCINDTIVHLATSHMPFGGVGESGMGSYHGKASFDTFSHSKSILKKSNRLDIPLRYPPHKENLSLLKRILK